MAIHQLTKERVAIKMLDKSKLDQKTRKMLAREIATMEAIHHPNIIRLYEVVETYSKIHLVMEYASGGELFNKITSIGKIAENEAKVVFAQVISAVQYMHENYFIHRDIKAENVFYAGPGLVKLGDFGFSTQLTSGNQQLNTFCGSPPYAAPELFRDESYLGAPVDIWALGVLLYFMVTAQMPFKAQTVATLKKHIMEGEFTIPGHVSYQCRKVIEAILKKVPKERQSLQEVRNSEWLRGVCFPPTPGLSESYILRPTIPAPEIEPKKTEIAKKTPKNVEESKKNEEESKKNEEESKKNEEESKNNEEESKMNEEESKMNEEESKMNEEESKMNEEESKMNEEESKMNEEESKMNEEESKKNGGESKKNGKESKETGTVKENEEHENCPPAEKSEGNGVDDTSQEMIESVPMEEDNGSPEKKDSEPINVEVLARRRLQELGITSELLEDHSSRCARSAVIGTYRIVIHQIQRQGHIDTDVASLDDGDPSPSTVPSRSPSTNHFFLPPFGKRSKSAAVKTKGAKPDRNNRSRTCSLL